MSVKSDLIKLIPFEEKLQIQHEESETLYKQKFEPSVIQQKLDLQSSQAICDALVRFQILRVDSPKNHHYKPTHFQVLLL